MVFASTLLMSLACRTTTPPASGSPGYSDARKIDRRKVLLTDWTPPPLQHCVVAERPSVLPPIDSLLAPSDVPILLEQGGLDSPAGYALLSIRFDSLGTATRVRVIETDMPGTSPDVVEQVFASAVRRQAPGEEWSVRVRVAFDSVPRYVVGRSEKCEAVLVESFIPSGYTRAAPVGAALDRQVEKRKITMHWTVVVGSDGTVIDAKPGSQYVDSDLAAAMTQRIRSERYYAALDDGIPVPSSLDVKRIITIVAVVRGR